MFVCHTNSICLQKREGILSNSKVFNVELFKQNLQIGLGNPVGYTIVIAQGGQLADSATFGIGAINAAAGTTIRPSIYHDINIASVTKSFTAMAVIKLMESRGQLMNFPINLWLPNSWPKHGDVQAITFEQLLSQTSGIRMASTSYDSLKFLVANPVTAPKTYSYANANFGLFRIILPKLWDANIFNQQEASLSATDFEDWIDQRYIELMNQLVFAPAGIGNVNCSIDPNVTTIQAFSETPNGIFNPQSFGDWTNRSGGGGFYLSTAEMAQVMSYLANTSSILTQSQKNAMDQNLYGWDPNDVFNTNYGRVYGKDGALFLDLNNDNGLSLGDAGLQTWVGKFPNKVELAMTVNSVGGSFRSLAQIARQAYEDAWVDTP